MLTRLTIALAATTVLALTASATPVGWVNGDFELGSVGWSVPNAVVGDHDDDGDQEARVAGCTGDIRIARGLGMGPLPATTPIELDVETGYMNFWSFRVILADATNPEPYANNYNVLAPNWLDDQVLAWQGNYAVSGHAVLDPLHATGFNIPGWSAMTPAERAAELATYVHTTIVVYGCGYGATGGATLDNFAYAV